MNKIRKRKIKLENQGPYLFATKPIVLKGEFK